MLLTLVAAPVFACGPGAPPCVLADGGAYHLRLPDGPGPHPAIMFLHGHGGSGAMALRDEKRFGDFLAAGWAVIAPDGAPMRDGGPRSWNAMASPALRDDVAFLGAVADDAAARFGLDRGRMAATGFSAGAMMVWRLACDAPDAYLAFAPVAGTLWNPLPDHCAGPAPLLHVHGTTDKVVPLEGRSLANGRLVQGNLFSALSMMRRTMSCTGAAAVAAPDGWTAEAWTLCTGRGAITLMTHGGGHMVPPGWAVTALGFFAAHPRG
jgi:polyhydroxybutyrate depolymerase